MRTNETKAHAIELSPQEVRATQYGCCTVLHRVVKKAAAKWLIDHTPEWVASKAHDLCPFGHPGEFMWGREAWSQDFAKHYPFTDTWYRADDDRSYEIKVKDGVRGIYSPEHDEHVPFRWRSSRCMPRKASRLLFEITGLRVVRLHEVSDEQIIASGVRHLKDDSGTWAGREGPGRFVAPWVTAREAFMDRWEHKHGHRSWDLNPWVWQIEFQKVLA